MLSRELGSANGRGITKRDLTSSPLVPPDCYPKWGDHTIFSVRVRKQIGRLIIVYVFMYTLDKSIGNGFVKNNNVFGGSRLDHHFIPCIKIKYRWAEELNVYRHILKGNK